MGPHSGPEQQPPIAGDFDTLFWVLSTCSVVLLIPQMRNPYKLYYVKLTNQALYKIQYQLELREERHILLK